MSNTEDKQIKLAPIFVFKSSKIKDRGSDKSDTNKRKRKKKSPKNENKNKINKKLDDSGDNSHEPQEPRKSKRLKHKVIERMSYNEDTDEELLFDTKSVHIIDKLNESVVLLDESSHTIDYWTDHSTDHNTDHNTQESSQIESTDEEIEIIPSDNNSKSVCRLFQETLVSSSQSECLLWTEKYKPTHSSQVIGHKVAVNRLKSWLEDWGKCDSKRDMLSEDDSENSLDETNACLLICGPTGCGKTSMVYAIAEELNYEILELNASMKRNGRIISKILGEATQSHQMQRNIDSNASTPSIQSFFTSVADNSINRVKNDKIVKKAKPKGILNYFIKQTVNDDIEIIEDKLIETHECQAKSESVLKINDKSSNDCSLFVPKALSIANRSLILFDDIDVMIDDDFIGFWNAFNRINETTKKPVILTATQYMPYIKSCVNRLQVLTLNKPNPSEVVTALQDIYDKQLSAPENDNNSEYRTEVYKRLSSTYDYDIRRCLNQLQFEPNCEHMDSHPKSLTDGNNLDINSYYDSLLFADVMQTHFRILNISENRNNWMKCKPTSIENEFQTVIVAKDIIESVEELNYSITRRRIKLKESSKPIDSETIQSISQYMSPNINIRTILLDYFPFLSMICNSESIRQSQIANHSRRSRRFMHYLDSIGFYFDNVVKTKLVSAFSYEDSHKILDHKSEETHQSNVCHQIDPYFYE